VRNALIALAVLLLVFGGYKVVSGIRGIRNKNPFNLVITGETWRGKLMQNTDGHFEQFDTMVNGVRAGFIDVIGDMKLRGLTSIRKLINTYAPESENDTKAYIASVSAQTGIHPDAVVKSRDDFFRIGQAIVRHENGAIDGGLVAGSTDFKMGFESAWQRFINT